MKHTTLLFLILAACSLDETSEAVESESGSEGDELEFRAAGDPLTVSDFDQIMCKAPTGAPPIVSTSPYYCDDAAHATGFADVICQRCGVDNLSQPTSPFGTVNSVLSGWDFVRINLVTGANVVDCDGTLMYADAGREWQVIADECNDVAAINIDAADGCSAHVDADGCASAEATTWRVDGSPGVLCCQQGTGNGAGGNNINVGSYECTPMLNGADTCASLDGFTVEATCTPCEGYTIMNTQGTNADNSNANAGAWDSQGTLSQNLIPNTMGGEWAGAPYCAVGTQDEPDAVAGCHYSRYQCRGDLRDAVTGAVLDWTNQDECGPD